VSLAHVIANWPSTGVLLIDRYEILTALDGWLRETFLPQLPAQSVVVIASRNPPTSPWRTDIDWAELTRIAPLRDLRPDECQAYLTMRGIADDLHPDILAFTHGHPLALSLVADVLGRRGEAAVATLAGEHDLVVVATGRGALGTLFPRIAEHSPFTSPQRLVVGGFFHGVALDSPLALDVTYVPGQGEILSFPVISFEPGLTVIAFESIAGGAFETVARMRYVDDPRSFEASALDLLRIYAPSIHARIAPDAFTISRQLDLCHAAITPTVRAGYRRLETGRYVVALGDAHVVNDPIIGQGANTASYAAWALGEAILDAQRFDEAFCRDVEQRIWAFTQPVTEGTNGRLRPPQPHMLEVLRAATQHQTVADAYAWGFNHPEHFWAAMSTPEQAKIFLADVSQLETAPVMASGY